jgi:hypothetical protein
LRCIGASIRFLELFLKVQDLCFCCFGAQQSFVALKFVFGMWPGIVSSVLPLSDVITKWECNRMEKR